MTASPLPMPAEINAPLRSEAEILSGWRGATAPVISVVCATYSHEQFIDGTLRGIFSQVTSIPFEVIVRDDGSTDGTPAILREYAARYPAILRVVTEPQNTYRRGVKPQSVTFPMSRGKFIAICDGDDWWTDPTKLEQQHEFLKNNADYVLCHHDATVVDERGDRLTGAHFRGLAKNAVRAIAGSDYSKTALQEGASLTTSTVMFRNCISEYPMYFHRVALGDAFLFSLLGRFGKAKHLSSIKPILYRVHPNGLWSRQSSTDRALTRVINHLSLSVHYRGEPETAALAGYYQEWAAAALADITELPWRLRLALLLPNGMRLHSVLKWLLGGLGR